MPISVEDDCLISLSLNRDNAVLQCMHVICERAPATIASDLGSHPAFCRLQYEKWSESLEDVTMDMKSWHRGVKPGNVTFMNYVQALTPLFVLQAIKSWMRA